MKKMLQYVLIIVLFSFWGIIITNGEQYKEVFQRLVRIYQRPCAKPIKYSIGKIDPQFQISDHDLRNILQESEKIWENPSKKNLFEYDPTAELKINLVYDERQERTVEGRKLENKLESLETTHESLIQKYNNINSTYKKRMDDYNESVADYEKRLAEYNKDVEKWNSEGGAPPDIYEKLKKEKKDLQELQAQLEKERKAINSLIGQTNEIAAKEKDVISKYNTSVDTYKNKYGAATQFDKGVFNGEEINVYQFNETGDLRLTLAHEFGHALGIDHLQSPQSIMYYLMGEQDMNNSQLSREDTAALNNVCFIK